MMKRYDKITIIRNRHRARDLRRFRDIVEAYFEQAEYVADGIPADWEGARTARAQINQMLPRVLQIVRAAGLGEQPADVTDPGPTMANVDALRFIFGPRYADGAHQEILDVIDMALGVYEASRFSALARTVNPLHYTAVALAYLAGLPRRTLKAVGVWPRSRASRIRPEDMPRLEAVAARLANVEEMIERRFAEFRDRQARQLAANTDLLEELAERVDFAERVLTQQRSPERLKAPDVEDASTPV